MSKYAENHEKMLLNKLQQYIDKEEYKYESPYITKADVEVIIPALEKQIPKKPQNKKYSFYPHSTVLKSKYGECPACKSIQADDEYCANCGQKLDWSDES